MKLLPSRRVLCTPYNHAPCHFVQSHIRKVYACLAVTCHLYFWQNDRGLLRATAVTRGWKGYEIRVSTESWPRRRQFSYHFCRDWNPRPFDHESGALTTELSQRKVWHMQSVWRLHWTTIRLEHTYEWVTLSVKLSLSLTDLHVIAVELSIWPRHRRGWRDVIIQLNSLSWSGLDSGYLLRFWRKPWLLWQRLRGRAGAAS